MNITIVLVAISRFVSVMDQENSLVSLKENLSLFSQLNPKLQNKAKKWKPSELEAAVLKAHFQDNDCPTTAEKESIIKIFEVKFDYKVKIGQITQWFQDERVKTSNKRQNMVMQNTYRKFKKGELDHLNEEFSKNRYPTQATMTSMAHQLTCSLSKIENWYKHNRRNQAKEGHMTLKMKKYFTKDELDYLVNLFRVNPCPAKQQITEMAELLNCQSYHIKNWYSNRRKKFRLLDKKNQLQDIQAVSTLQYAALPSLDFQRPLKSGELTAEIPFISEDCNNSFFGPQSQVCDFPLSTSMQQIPANQSMSDINFNTSWNAPQMLDRNPNLMMRNLPNTNMLSQLHAINNTPSFPQLRYPNTNNLNNSNFAFQNTPFCRSIQLSENTSIWNQNAIQIIPSMKVSNQTSIERVEFTFQQQTPIQGAEIPHHNRVYEAIPNESFANLAQPYKRLIVLERAPLTLAQNPIQYVIIVNPNQH